MRNLKKVLSLTLAMVMLLGMMVMGAGAAGYKDEADITKTEAVDVMSALKIFEGTDGSFNPQKSLTRAQAAKILVYVSDGPAVANALGQSDTKFTDVPADHWASGFVAYCANLGIVSGTTPTTFAPDKELTAEQFAKMLLVAMGSEADYTGTAFSSNVRRDAIKAKIDENVGTFVWNKPLPREQACQMAFNALIKTLDGGKTVYDVDGVKFDNLNDAAMYAALLNKDSTETVKPKKEIDTTGTLGLKNYNLKYENIQDDLGNNITKWVANDKVEVVIDKSSDALITVSGEDYKAGDKGTTKGYTFAKDLECKYNGTKVSGESEDEWYTKMAGVRGVTLKFYGSDKTINRVVVEEPYFAKVTAVSKKGDKITLSVYEAGYAMENSGKTATVTINEDDADYDLVKDMAKDDVFMGIFSPGWNLTGANRKPLMDVVGTPDTFEGKVSGAKISKKDDVVSYNKSTITVDGEVHKFASEYSREEVALKSEGTFYTFNGYLYHFEGKTAAGPDGYALIVNAISNTETTLDSSTISLQVRAILSDGTVGVYKVALDDDNMAGGVEIGSKDWKDSVVNKVFTYSIEDDVLTLGATEESGKGSVADVKGYTGGSSTKDGEVLFNAKTAFVLYDGKDAKTTAKLVTGVANLGSVTNEAAQAVLGDNKLANVVFIKGSSSPVTSGDYVYVDVSTVGTELGEDDATLVTYVGITPDGDEVTVYTGKELADTASGVYNISEDSEIVGKAFTTTAYKNYKTGMATVLDGLLKIGSSSTYYTTTEDTKVVDITGEVDVNDYTGAKVMVILEGDLATVATVYITAAPKTAE